MSKTQSLRAIDLGVLSVFEALFVWLSCVSVIYDVFI